MIAKLQKKIFRFVQEVQLSIICNLFAEVGKFNQTLLKYSKF